MHGSALGSVLCASLACLASLLYVVSVLADVHCASSKAGRGGQIVGFQSSIPTIGGGALGPREQEESTLYATGKEKALFVPRNPFWRDLAEECAEEGIGVSLFLAPAQPMDLGSIGEFGLNTRCRWLILVPSDCTITHRRRSVLPPAVQPISRRRSSTFSASTIYLS